MTSSQIDAKIHNAYQYVIDIYGANIGVEKGNHYVDQVNQSITKTIKSLQDIVNNEKDLPYLKGDLAEVWHAGTANIRASAKHGEAKEYFVAPRDSSPIDISGTDAISYLKQHYQVKYYRSPEATAKAISNPKYTGLLKIVPSDQLEDVKKAAEKLYLQNHLSRPDVADSYRHTASMVSDRIKAGNNIESNPLSEREAIQIVKELQEDKFSGAEHGLTLSQFVEWSDIAKASGEAALSTAITTIVLKTAPEIMAFIYKALKDEKISLENVKKLGGNVIEGGFEGSLRGGIAAFISIACKSGKLGESFTQINPSVIGIATALAINGIKNGIQLYKKEISSYEFVDRCMQDGLFVGLGTLGLVLGQTFIPIPIFGAIIGSIVGTTLTTIVYTGAKTFVLKPLLISGFTLFGLVKQDHTLPDEVIKELNIEEGDIEEGDIEEGDIEEGDSEEGDIEEGDIEKVELIILKRGFIKVNVIGYIIQ